MCRFLMAEQLLGLIFEQLVSRQIEHISVDRLFEIERDVDINTRKKNDAIICMSTQELYHAVDTYSGFFELEERSIKLHDNFYCEIKQDSEDENCIRQTLQHYFSDTVPADIRNTVNLRLAEILSA